MTMLEMIRNILVLIPMSLWFGGAVAIGFFTAPAVFGGLSSRTLAGEIMTVIFGKLRLVEYITMVALFASELLKYLALPQARGMREYWITGLIVAFLLVQLFSVAVVSPKIESIRAQIESFDDLPKDDPQRQAFGMWHGISMLCMVIGLGLSAAILIVYFVPLKTTSV